jgi:hypothetical protein
MLAGTFSPTSFHVGGESGVSFRSKNVIGADIAVILIPFCDTSMVRRPSGVVNPSEVLQILVEVER